MGLERMIPRIKLLGIFHDAAGKIDHAFEGFEIAKVVFHRLFGTTAQCCRFDQTVLGERGDVVAVLAGEAADFANRGTGLGYSPHSTIEFGSSKSAA